MTKVETIKGDITKLQTDAIVNAANEGLWGGGGVDGAIHKAGGPEIGKACKKIRESQGGCPTGKAVITTAGLLPCRYVIHAVGPVWNGGRNEEERLLGSAYHESLLLGCKYEIRSIAFPNISTGIYGFPRERAAAIAIDTISGFISGNTVLESIIFVCYDDENFQIYKRILHRQD